MRARIFSTFATTALIVVLTLATSIVLARNLGPEARGTLLALTFWPAVWTAFFNFSLQEATAYHVARAGGVGDADKARELEASGLALQLSAAFISTSMSLMLLSALLPESRRMSLATVLWFSAGFSPLTVLDLHFKAVLQARGALDHLNLARLAQPIAYAAILLTLALRREISVESAMAAMVAALACSLVIAAWCAGAGLRHASVESARVTFASGWKFHLANLVLYTANEVDKFIVLQLLDDTGIGYYAIATGVSTLGSGIVVQSLAVILAQRMSAAAHDSERADLLLASLFAGVAMLVLINGAAAALAFLWLPLLYGAEFAPAVVTAAILLQVGTLRGLRQITDRSLRAAHITSVGMVGEVVALVAVVGCAIVGHRLAGLEGLALGLAVAHAVALGVMLVLATRAFSIPLGRLWPLHRDNAALLHKLAGLARRG